MKGSHFMKEHIRILSNQPIGQDLFVSKSQEKIAEAISNQLKSRDAQNILEYHLIGIEGSWGTGKSNLIKIIESKLNPEEFFFFLYDSWGHQEDIHRRAIINGLVKFIKEKKLLKDRAINSLVNKSDLILGKQICTKTVYKPEFSWGFFLFILSIFLYHFGKILIQNLFFNVGYFILALGVVSFSFIIILAFCNSWNSSKEIFFQNLKNNLLTIYNKEQKNNTETKFVNQANPSTDDFSEFLSLIDKGLQNKKLIIVIDNLDRLEKGKVKDLWSTIHMCFTGTKLLKNIIVIVPFDKEKIQDVFLESYIRDDSKIYSNKEALLKVDDFIQKTFSIVFRVSYPVLTDWESYFEMQWYNAFGNISNNAEFDLVKRIFDIFTSRITPRSIIAFINECVSIKMAGVDSKIKFRYIAVFIKKKNEILSNITDALLNYDYLEPISYLFETNRIEYLESIAALVYQVPIEKGIEVALIKTIKDSLETADSATINKISNIPSFNPLLGEVLHEIKNLPNAILALKDIKVEQIPSKAALENRWDDIYARIIASYKEGNMGFESNGSLMEYELILLDNIRQDKKLEYVKSLLHEMDARISNQSINAFTYSCNIDNLNLILEKYKIDVFSMLKEQTVDIESFKGLMESEKNIKKYGINCQEEKVNEYLIDKLNSGIDNIGYIPNLLECRFKLDKFKEQLKNKIRSTGDTTKLINLMKILKDFHGVIDYEINIGSLVNCISYAEKENDEFYFDLIAYAFSKYPYNILSQYNIKAVNEDYKEKNINKIAERMKHYTDSDIIFEKLINQDMQKCKLYKQVCLYLLKSKSIKLTYHLLPKFISIQEVLELNTNTLAQAFKPLDSQEISKDEFEASISVELIRRLKDADNSELFMQIKKTASNYLNILSQEEWRDLLSDDINQYFMNVAMLIEYKWPAIAFEEIKKFLLCEIDNMKAPDNRNTWKELFNQLKKAGHSLENLVHTAYDKFLKSTITNDQFRFWYGLLAVYCKEEITAKTFRCLFPVSLMDDKDCIDLLLNKIDFIKESYKLSGEEKNDFKNSLIEKLKKDDVPNYLRELALKMDIVDTDEKM